MAGATERLFHDLYMEHFIHALNVPIMHWFVAVILVDIITGTLKALINKDVDSHKGTSGLLKHAVLLLVVLILYPLLEIDGFTYAGNAILTFYIAFYGLSIVENLGEMGVPIPESVKQYLYKLNGDSSEKSLEIQKDDEKDGDKNNQAEG